MMRGTLGFALLLSVAAHGCSKGEQLDPEVEKLGRATGPVDHDAMRAMGAPKGGGRSVAGGGTVHSGKILETMQVPRYTYMLLDVGDGAQVWTAVSSAEVQVGQEVQVVESITMRDFHSRTLDRTFPRIVFGNIQGTEVPGSKPDGGLPPGHRPIDVKPAPAAE